MKLTDIPVEFPQNQRQCWNVKTQRETKKESMGMGLKKRKVKLRERIVRSVNFVCEEGNARRRESDSIFTFFFFSINIIFIVGFFGYFNL